MLQIPRPELAQEDLVRMMNKVADQREAELARLMRLDSDVMMERLNGKITDAYLERAADPNEPVNLSSPSKDQHHC